MLLFVLVHEKSALIQPAMVKVVVVVSINVLVVSWLIFVQRNARSLVGSFIKKYALTSPKEKLCFTHNIQKQPGKRLTVPMADLSTEKPPTPTLTPTLTQTLTLVKVKILKAKDQCQPKRNKPPPMHLMSVNMQLITRLPKHMIENHIRFGNMISVHGGYVIYVIFVVYVVYVHTVYLINLFIMNE